MDISQNRVPTVRWRSVALPTEHGAWAFVSEPLLLGLLLAPTWAGLALAIATLGAFLLRQPLKTYLKDVRSQRMVPRTYMARRFILLYGSVMIVAGLAALLLSPSPDAFLPLVFALPLFALQLFHDIRNQSRAVTAELAGTLATGALASSMVMLQGWALIPALGLWLIMAAKATTAVLYVRSRLRLERVQSAGIAFTVAVHIAALTLLVIAAAYGWIRWIAPFALGMLMVRAAIGLSPLRKTRPPKIIGMQEVVYGLSFVLLIVLGYKLG